MLQAGWVGMGKDKDTADRSQHVARPLSSLKDPASFGPPPKHIKYHGPAADRGGLGAPLTQEQPRQQNAQQQAQAEAEEQREKPAPPPRPYRADTTGLSTGHLPPPPRRAQTATESGVADPKPKPSLPPRLPPRTNSGLSQATSPSPPPAYSPTPNPESQPPGQLNQDAVSRLAQAGVSVPALGIGSSNAGTQAGAERNNPVNELQARFSQMSTSSSAGKTPLAQGTTLAEKQAALRTVQKLHNDPSSVSVAEARSAASTVNNFRERHGDQIQAGMKKLSGLNEKYGVTKRINSFIEDQKSPANPPPGSQQLQGHPPPQPPRPSEIDREALSRRKPPPPPPPPKKPQMQSTPPHARPAPPPPVPLETKPRC